MIPSIALGVVQEEDACEMMERFLASDADEDDRFFFLGSRCQRR
jgi:hypothetical protein